MAHRPTILHHGHDTHGHQLMMVVYGKLYLLLHADGQGHTVLWSGHDPKEGAERLRQAAAAQSHP